MDMTALPLKSTPAQLSDEDVVRRVVAGETELFEILMRRYNQRVYRAVRAIVRDDAEAEDVLQQAYVNAYQHLHRFEERARFSTWLTRIAINEALARVRRNKQWTMEESMPELESQEHDPERQAASSELREVMESEISALPEMYRAVLMLREVEGLSTAETAECLSISEDLVKQRLHRARTILRDNLYRRAGIGLDTLFAFGSARCDRVVARVMARLMYDAPP